jgi:hypothetical protein
VAIKVQIHAPTFFLPSLLFLPFLLNKQNRYIHILHVPLSRLFACNVVLQNSGIRVSSNDSSQFSNFNSKWTRPLSSPSSSRMALIWALSQLAFPAAR